MSITTIGIDLAKNIFQVHGVTEDARVAFNKPLRRARILPFLPKLSRVSSVWKLVAALITGRVS